MVAAHETRFRRRSGLSRLIEHCEAVGRLTASEPTSARTRLASAIGPDLADRLVGALGATGAGRARAA